MTCRLQEVRPRAPYVLAAPMAMVIALTALVALGLSGAPFHERSTPKGLAYGCFATVRNTPEGAVSAPVWAWVTPPQEAGDASPVTAP